MTKLIGFLAVLVFCNLLVQCPPSNPAYEAVGVIQWV